MQTVPLLATVTATAATVASSAADAGSSAVIAAIAVRRFLAFEVEPKVVLLLSIKAQSHADERVASFFASIRLGFAERSVRWRLLFPLQLLLLFHLATTRVNTQHAIRIAEACWTKRNHF